jgi:hypothetical protein
VAKVQKFSKKESGSRLVAALSFRGFLDLPLFDFSTILIFIGKISPEENTKWEKHEAPAP